MTTDPDALTIVRYGPEQARGLSGQVRDVFTSSHGDAVAGGNDFESPEAFMERFDSYVAHPRFDLVVAHHERKPVGQAWGWPLSAGSAWWSGLLHEPEPGFSHEDGTRTFALSEIMVAATHQKRGIARAMHDELLGQRRERRATLLAQASNTRAFDTYLRWGWRPVAQLRPGWQDAPLFEVLVLDLA